MMKKLTSFEKLRGIISLIALALIIFGYPIAFYSSMETRIITVDDKERATTGNGKYIQSMYLVYTDGEVFKNTDSVLVLKFNSSDVQNQLKEGETYKVQVAGWRILFLSMYRNILSIENIQANI
jgi:hypothetical protein